MNSTTYEYNQQIRKYLLQFMAIFSGMHVKIGQHLDIDPTLVPVTIHYGHADRVVASIIANNNQNTPIRLPTMSANISAIEIRMDRMKGVGSERRTTYLPMGGIIPDDVTVLHQLMPIPYNINMDLSIFTSNTEQQLQVLEQILPMFTPQLCIQTTDAAFDWTRLTSVHLRNIATENNYPVGADSRINQTTITFEIPIYIGVSAQRKHDFIERVKMRIGAIDYSSTDSYQILADLDAQNIPYETIEDIADFPFQ